MLTSDHYHTLGALHLRPLTV